MLYFLKDHLGSTMALTTAVFNNEMTRDYYPYGQDLKVTAGGNSSTNYLFTGKELNNVTGLYYFGARYYNGEVGRWLVPDPLGQYFSPYIYCSNNPLKIIDLNGEFGFLIPAIIFAVAFFTSYDNLNAPGLNDPVYQERGLVETSFENALKYSAITSATDLFLNDSSKPKHPGSGGNQDYKKAVKNDYKELTDENRGQDKTVLTQKKVRGYPGVNRIPDNQVVDNKTGKTERIVERERRPNSKRNREREKEYDKNKISNETHPIEIIPKSDQRR